MRIEKLLLIYKYTILGENNPKLIYDMFTGSKMTTKKGRNFARYTEQENKEFLLEWYKRNKIKMSDYKVCLDLNKAQVDKNGLPIIVRRVANDITRKN